MRALRLGAISCVAAAAVGLLVSASCKTFNFPDETCSANDLVDLTADASARAACVTCLESSASCDRVGRCATEPSDCKARVQATHRCILDKGTQSRRDEDDCRNKELRGQAAFEAFQAMGDHCREPCGLHVCNLDPAVAQIGSATCDRCVAASCCAPINECYANRTCKLILDCITQGCDETLTFDLGGGGGGAGGGGAGDDDESGPQREDASAGGPCGADDRGGPPRGLPPCISACLAKFSTHELGGGRLGLCLAFRVAQCGVNAGCGADCPGPREDLLDGGDAGTDGEAGP